MQTRNRPLAACLMYVLLCATLFCLLPHTLFLAHASGFQQSTTLHAQAETNQDAALQTYLRSRSLTELLLLELEQTVKNTPDDADRKNAAVELLEIYLAKMAEEKDRFDHWSIRIDELSRRFPDSIPLAMQVSIAFSRYRNAKTIFEEWVWKRNDTGLRREANSRFASVVQRTTDASERVDLLLKVAENATTNPEVLRTAMSQFQYLTAWARYYRGLTLADEQRRVVLLLAAEREFLNLLGVADLTQLQALTPQWFGLNSEWTCRIVLGMGMVQRALGRDGPADYCFNLLGDPRVPVGIASSRRVWNFHSTVFPGDLRSSINWVEVWRDNQNAKYDIAFWSSVATTGLSWHDSEDDLASRELAQVGLIGLVKANEFALVDELIQQYPNIRISGDHFFQRWAQGYVHLKKYESRNQRAAQSINGFPDGETEQNTLPVALQQLRTALTDNQSNVDSVYRARCRYHLGFALYLDRQLAKASEQFRQAEAVLNVVDPRLAEHASWMRCQTLEALVTKDLVWRNQFDYALKGFQERFPRSRHITKVAFMKIMNQVSSVDVANAHTILQNIPEDDPNFQRARFELCRLQHQAWLQLSDVNERNQQATQLLATAEDFLSRFPVTGQTSSLEAQRVAQVCLLAADASWEQQKHVNIAQDWLDRCRKSLPAIDSYPGIGSDFYFIVLQLATSARDVSTQDLAAAWLLRNTSKARHIKAALIAKATVADSQLQIAFDADQTVSNEKVHHVIDTYRRLIDEYEADDQEIDKNQRNITAARLRVAQLQLVAKMYENAKQGFTTLLKGDSKQVAYLVGLAECEYQLGKFSNAAGYFQTLAGGGDAGSESWLNAKYYLIRCLQQTDVDKARKILRQTTLLAPNPVEPWRTRFQDLAAQLEPRCP